MPTNVVEILQQCRLFADVGPRGFQRLAVMARLVQFERGQLIFREGDRCPGVYAVGEGMVRVFKSAPGGKEHVLHIVGAGGTFAEIAAIGGFDVPASADALSAATCALLPREPLRAALDEDHDLCREMLTGLSIWVKHLVGLLEDIVLRDAAGRVARFLVNAPRLPDGTLELPGLKRHVASHLNLTSETFSRTLRRFIDAGLVAEAENGRVRLLNVVGLQQVADGLFPRL
ncbi:MAG: Crp/Fnr family transcriptional regulator [Planctomycetota bacterium]